MTAFKEIPPEAFALNPFTAIGRDWMLIAASKDGTTNAMTASWGGLGVMWGKNVAFVVIRPQRYTREFVNGSGMFSLNFFSPEHHEALAYFGAVSGRDEDKIAKTGFSVESADNAPCFSQAHTALICRKLFAQPYVADSFIDRSIIDAAYPGGDFHTLYIGEVVRILGK